MKKSELKTGMRAINRKGEVLFVSLNSTGGDMLIDMNDSSWTTLAKYDEDLLRTDELSELDIVKIKTPCYNCEMLNPDAKTFVVYRRVVAKKMTLEELEAILGYGVEIVEEGVSK